MVAVKVPPNGAFQLSFSGGGAGAASGVEVERGACAWSSGPTPFPWTVEVLGSGYTV